VQGEFAIEIQSMARSGQAWLATDELSGNIRDHGRVVYGLTDIPMIGWPVLQHARVAMNKAERFATQAAQAVPPGVLSSAGISWIGHTTMAEPACDLTRPSRQVAMGSHPEMSGRAEAISSRG
jgi:hypothetical protein